MSVMLLYTASCDVLTHQGRNIQLNKHVDSQEHERKFKKVTIKLTTNFTFSLIINYM